MIVSGSTCGGTLYLLLIYFFLYIQKNVTSLSDLSFHGVEINPHYPQMRTEKIYSVFMARQSATSTSVWLILVRQGKLQSKHRRLPEGGCWHGEVGIICDWLGEWIQLSSLWLVRVGSRSKIWGSGGPCPGPECSSCRAIWLPELAAEVVDQSLLSYMV